MSYGLSSSEQESILRAYLSHLYPNFPAVEDLLEMTLNEYERFETATSAATPAKGLNTRHGLELNAGGEDWVF